MHNFTPYASLAGGALIGLSASMLLLSHGRIAGISGILGGTLDRQTKDRGWRVAFLIGLALGAGALLLARPQSFGPATQPLWIVAIAGLIVGYGTRLGNGCTSGHGVCGLPRMSGRSLAAVLTFMGTGAATTFLLRHVLGGS